MRVLVLFFTNRHHYTVNGEQMNLVKKQHHGWMTVPLIIFVALMDLKITKEFPIWRLQKSFQFEDYKKVLISKVVRRKNICCQGWPCNSVMWQRKTAHNPKDKIHTPKYNMRHPNYQILNYFVFFIGKWALRLGILVINVVYNCKICVKFPFWMTNGSCGNEAVED